jgi:universal stress protein E
MSYFRNILVHVDSRNASHPVLDRAVELAKEHNSKIKVVDVVPDFSWPIRMASSDYEQAQQHIADAKLAAIQSLVKNITNHGVQAEVKVLHGKASVALIDEVKLGKHDLVMKDAKGLGSRRQGWFGTTATRLMRFCPCHVWAYRPATNAQERVIAAVDVTAEDTQHGALNRTIMEAAFALCPGRRPHVIHVWTVYGERLIQDYVKRDEFQSLVEDAQKESRDRMADLLQPYGLSIDAPEVHMIHGAEDEEIPKLIKEQQFDVLVMGTIGRSGISGFFIGNTAEILLDRIPCSVLAVKAPATAN